MRWYSVNPLKRRKKMMNCLKGPVLPTLMIFCVTLLFGMLGQAHASPVSPLIQEVYYDQPGSDGDKVFTEIYGPPGMSLTNFYLKGINGSDGGIYRTINLSGAVLPSNGLLVVARSGFISMPEGSYFVGNVEWQNGPDAVQLWYDDGTSAPTRYDALAYGDVPNYGEGNAALDVPAGQSLSRVSGIDTDNNLADFSASSPTPGVVPIPCAAWLLGSGLIGLVGVRRRFQK
jgi:hypothetical protein